MSITFRLNDWSRRTSRDTPEGGKETFRLKSNPGITSYRQNSIYEDIDSSCRKDKRNVLERFQELRKKMASRANERHKLDLARQFATSPYITPDELSCQKIISQLSQKTEELRNKPIKSHTSESSRFKTKTFQPYKENNNVRIIYNTGGRVVEFTPAASKEAPKRDRYKTPVGQPRIPFCSDVPLEETASKRDSRCLEKGILKEGRRRVYSTAPKRKQPLKLKEGQDLQPWESQQITENQNQM